jgi:hypothetical protein
MKELTLESHLVYQKTLADIIVTQKMHPFLFTARNWPINEKKINIQQQENKSSTAHCGKQIV